MRSIAQSAMRLWQNAERSRALLPIMTGICLACIGSAMPVRATVEAHLAGDQYRVEIMVTAAVG